VKILIVVHDYLPLHAGGAEIHAHQVATELVRRGHDVVAVFTERDLDAPEGEIRRGELDGVRTVELVHQREYADVGDAFRQTAAGEAFRQILAEERPDAIHAHHLSLWGSGILPAAREAGVRVVLTLHDYHLLCDNGFLLRRDGTRCEGSDRGRCGDCVQRHPLLPGRWTTEAGGSVASYQAAHEARFLQHRSDLAAVDTAIAPSHFLAGVFRDAGLLADGQIEVLPYGFPGERHGDRPAPPVSFDRPLRVGTMGGIYAAKGVHVAVGAFTRLEGIPAELHIHGHSAWFPEYTTRLEKVAEGRPITFHGPYDPGQVDQVLAGLDLLVVPSLWFENLPLTIHEAFRNGVPVVASDLGGMAEVIADGTSGLLFPPGDVEALAERIRTLAADPDLLARLSAGRPEVSPLEPIVDRLEQVYRGE